MTAAHAIELIHETGGLAVIAHLVCIIGTR